MTTVVPFKRKTFGSEDDLLHLAYYLQKSGLSRDRVSELIHSIAEGYNPPLSSAHIMAGLDTAFCEEDAERRMLSWEINNWVSVTERDFCVTDCDKELHIVTKSDKANRRKTIQRLKEGGIIE